MNVMISGRQLQISRHLEEFIEEKTGKLAKHMPTLGEVRVEVALHETRADTDRYTCQITTWLDHHMLDSSSTASDIHKAINEAVAKVDGQLRKMKVQHQHKGRASLAANSDQTDDATAQR